ncbi:MAG: 4Fe-4S binding protein [Candidatus Heimdallarchaeota archaeon]
MKPSILKIYKKERKVAELPGAISSIEQSPERFEIPMGLINIAEQGKPNNIMNRSTAPPMISNIKNINKSYDSLSRNTSDPKKEITETLLNELKEFCKKQNIVNIGFTKLPHHLIFKDKAVLHDNAIVLVLEMDNDKIAKSPSRETLGMVMDTYNKLGIVANKVATLLRKHGYSAHASHPLGGIVLYPPLAASAGLGWFGRHGLLITPEFGPRVRIAAVFTNITNLPYSEKNPHSWIPEQCTTCGRCIEKCPPKALYEQPIKNQNGLLTHNDSSKCFPYFAANYGCSICIKVCPFSTTGYEKIKTKIMKKKK